MVLEEVNRKCRWENDIKDFPTVVVCGFTSPYNQLLELPLTRNSES